MKSIRKTCNRCKQAKPLTEFNKRSASPDGYAYTCRACGSKHHRQWRKQNVEHRKQYHRDYHEKNAETIRARAREWQRNNPERRNEQSRIARQRHPQRMAARSAVSNAVKLRKLPRITTRRCEECGAPAEHYHHHRGYAPEHWLDVVPMCQACHFTLHGD